MPPDIEAIRALLQEDPEDSLLHFGLANGLVQAGQLEEAVGEFEKTVALNPRLSAAYRAWGKALEALGRIQEARAVYQRGIPVAREQGDLQTQRSMEVFLKRLEKRSPP